LGLKDRAPRSTRGGETKKGKNRGRPGSTLGEDYKKVGRERRLKKGSFSDLREASRKQVVGRKCGKGHRILSGRGTEKSIPGSLSCPLLSFVAKKRMRKATLGAKISRGGEEALEGSVSKGEMLDRSRKSRQSITP